MRRVAAKAGARTARPGGDHGDYATSMTDLMLGLIFIFVIMLMGFALNLRSADSKTPDPPSQAAEADQARREMLREIAKLLEGMLPVTIDEENGTLQLGGDILFPKGSATAYPAALPKLRLLGYALGRVLPCYAAPGNETPSQCALAHAGRLDAVYVEGHADASPIHTPRFQSNWDLSAARASETFRRLVEAEPELATLNNDKNEKLIGVSGYAQYRPVDDERTAQAMQRNRRIELRFIMASPAVPEAVGEVHAALSP